MSRALPATILACSALALVAAGCGGSSSTPGPAKTAAGARTGSSTNAAVAAAPAGHASASHTPHSAASDSPQRQYALYARLVNLRAADVPGFGLRPNRHAHVHIAALETPGAFKQCLPVAAQQKPLFDRSSSGFVRQSRLNYGSLSSHVEIMRSARAAEREFAAVRAAFAGGRFATCVQRRFASLGSQPASMSVKGHHVQITERDLRFAPVDLTPPAGTDAAAGFSMKFIVDYRFADRGGTIEVPVGFFVESFAFTVGRAEVSFDTFSISQPCSVQLEERLYSKLVARALSAGRVAPAAVKA